MEWTSSFDHYETRILAPIATPTENQPRNPETSKDKKEKEKEKRPEVYWCKEFQKGLCNEKPPHMASIKPDEPIVPVMHISAIFWQWDRKWKEHLESDPACAHKRKLWEGSPAANSQ